MHSLKLNIQDSVYDKIYYFLSNLPKHEVEIIENKELEDDWSYLEKDIDIGLNSGISENSHEDIVNNIKRKYA